MGRIVGIGILLAGRLADEELSAALFVASTTGDGAVIRIPGTTNAFADHSGRLGETSREPAVDEGLLFRCNCKVNVEGPGDLRMGFEGDPLSMSKLSLSLSLSLPLLRLESGLPLSLVSETSKCVASSGPK